MRNNNFDLLRLIAALSILLIHTTEHLLQSHGFKLEGILQESISISNQILGVPIFFLISGYLISMSYEKNPHIKEYTKNRILRIFPGLYVNILLGIIILSYFGFVQFNADFFKWLLAQLTLFQFYNPDMFRDFGVGVINGSLWTISIELTFYILVPIIFFLYKKNRVIIAMLLVFSFILWMYNLESSKEMILNKLIHVSIFPYLFLFFIGGFFYKHYKKLSPYINDKFIYWFILYLLFMQGTEYLTLQNNAFYFILKWLFFSFMIFSFAFSFRSLSNRLLRGNDYTYGIYIYHMLVVLLS